MREREVFIASSFSFQFWILLKLFWSTVSWFGKCSFKFCLDGFEAMLHTSLYRLHWLHVVERFVTDLNNVLHGWYGITWRVRNRNSTLILFVSVPERQTCCLVIFFFEGGGGFSCVILFDRLGKGLRTHRVGYNFWWKCLLTIVIGVNGERYSKIVCLRNFM